MAVRPQGIWGESFPEADESSSRALGRSVRPGRVLSRSLPVLVLIDALLLLAGLWGSTRLVLRPALPLASAVETHAAILIATLLVLLLGFLVLSGMLGMRSRRLSLSGSARVASRAHAWSGVFAAAFALLLAAGSARETGTLLLGQAVLLGVACVAASPLTGRLLARLASERDARRRVLVVGGDADARRVAALLEWTDGSPREIVGLADTRLMNAGRAPRWPRFALASWSDLPELADALAVAEVVIASATTGLRSAAGMAQALTALGIETLVAPDVAGLLVPGAPLRRDDQVRLVTLGRSGPPSRGLLAKRIFDGAAGALAAVLLLPLMLLITLAIKLTSPGPVLYAQTRIGRGGRPFHMYKFRSMVVANDDTRHRRYVVSLLKRGRAAGVDACGRPVYKIVDDPRVTAIGRLLRRTSLDELPQLLNVMRGEMSLVGPRPPLPFEYEIYEEWQKGRLTVTPGMTGLWQVSGRNLLSFEEMVLLDLYYASNWNFWLDLKLIWRTIPEVICARGAR